MNKIFIAILMGSNSDLSTMKTAFSTLKSLDIPFEAHILSAHRTPKETIEFVENANERGCVVFIAAAGLAAHLAGTIAAHTIKPVIGVPMASGSLGGLDALLSTIQMPDGVPVACTTIGKVGAKNAAILAAQIIALHDKTVAKKLMQQRAAKWEMLKKADENLQTQL